MHDCLAYICNTTDVSFHMSQASCVGENQEDESCSQWPSSSQDAVSHWFCQACKTCEHVHALPDCTDCTGSQSIARKGVGVDVVLVVYLVMCAKLGTK